MMLTRCPACQTVFRLRPEQLHARRGEVRCGHCFHPFNALEHALEPPANENPGPPPPAPDFFVLEDKPAPTLAGSSPASMLDFGIPEPEPEPVFAPEPQREPARTEKPGPFAWEGDQEAAPQLRAAPPAAADDTLANASAPAFEPTPHPRPAPSAPYEPATHEPAETALPKVFPGVLRSGRRPPPPTEAQAAVPDDAVASPDASTDITSPPSAPESAWAASDVPQERAPREVTEDAAPETPDAASDEPDLARLDATYGRPPRKTHPALRALGGMLVVVLTALLGLQTAYLYRMEIARDLPGLRPLLTEACARAGCTIPYPQDAERIAIEASDLQAEPGKPGRYLLHATLNNRAEYPQRWPHLELTLTDAGDNPMSRRVLAPAEWMNPAETAEAFPPRNAIELRLPFEVPGLAPTGYRIYAFYP